LISRYKSDKVNTEHSEPKTPKSVLGSLYLRGKERIKPI